MSGRRSELWQQLLYIRLQASITSLVGTGYSFFKDSRPSFLGGTLFPHEEEGELTYAAVSDEHGVISWVKTIELKVIGFEFK